MEHDINIQDIQEAAMLHDFGKVLIPKEILHKKGTLTPIERKIIELHSEFGYELLKQLGVRKNVLSMIKYHHQKPDKSGYPKVEEEYEYDFNTQILKAADMYTALTEERSYHKSFTKEEALKIISKEVENGIISQEVFNALKKSI